MHYRTGNRLFLRPISILRETLILKTILNMEAQSENLHRTWEKKEDITSRSESNKEDEITRVSESTKKIEALIWEK